MNLTSKLIQIDVVTVTFPRIDKYRKFETVSLSLHLKGNRRILRIKENGDSRRFRSAH